MKQVHPSAQANVTEKKEVNHATQTPTQAEVEKAKTDYQAAKDGIIKATRSNGLRPHPSAEKAMVSQLKHDYEVKKALYESQGKGVGGALTDPYEMEFPADKFMISEVRDAIISTEKARDEMIRQMKLRNELYQKYGLPEDYHFKK